MLNWFKNENNYQKFCLQSFSYFCPVRKKRIILKNVEVADYAAEGKCISKVDGKAIFISKAVPGDIVDVLLSKNKKDWAEGSPIRFEKYSEKRVEAFCSHFGVCGGCQWQMLPYSLQLEYKYKQVVETLKRIAKVELPEIYSIIGSDNTTHYRNKLEFTFSNKKYLLPEELNDETITSLQNVGGFHAKGFFDKVVDINNCHLMNEPSNLIRNTVKEYCIENNLEFYDIRLHTGFIRNMMVRVATTGEVMVNIVVANDHKKQIEDLCQHVLNKIPAVTTLYYTINTKMNDSLYDLEPILFYGKGYIEEKLEDFTFKISPKSFFQTNTKQAEKLYTITRDFAELSGTEIVYDLYCGTGSIGIFVSKQAQKIIGVETVEDAIIDAKENALYNNLTNAQFFAGDVIDVCNDSFFAQQGKPDVIITDPPRAGMHEKLVQKLLEIEAPLIVYVSCNPATQARDLSLLDAKYIVTKVQPVDMFPHTLHIENIVQLKLRRNI